MAFNDMLMGEESGADFFENGFNFDFDVDFQQRIIHILEEQPQQQQQSMAQPYVNGVCMNGKPGYLTLFPPPLQELATLNNSRRRPESKKHSLGRRK